MGADTTVPYVVGMTREEAQQRVKDRGFGCQIVGDGDTITDQTPAGGAIIPGVQLSLSALASHTSLLPAISLDAPPHAIGTNTVDCMKSGSILGAALLLDGMIDRMEAELGQKTTVVATGGLARCIVPICTHEILLNEDLLLYGLAVLYEKNR